MWRARPASGSCAQNGWTEATSSTTAWTSSGWSVGTEPIRSPVRGLKESSDAGTNTVAIRSLCRAAATAQDPLVALAQLAFEAELRQVEEARAGGVLGQVLLLRERVRAVVRIVVALAVPELGLLAGVAGVAQMHRDFRCAVLAHPPARLLDRHVRRVRLRRKRE